jgi:hypothetical protein
MDLQPPTLTAYRFLSEDMNGLQIRPGERDRIWIDAGHPRARECPPFRVANAAGWEIVSPFFISATWKGGDARPIVKMGVGSGWAGVEVQTRPNGAIAIMLPWIIRTSPGWSLWFRGAPNHRPKPTATPLEAVIETDWLDRAVLSTQWKFHTPGLLEFMPWEPIGFFTLTPHALIDGVKPEMRWGTEDPEIYEALVNRRAVAENGRDVMQAQAYARGIRSSDLKKTTTPHRPGLRVCPFARNDPAP